MHSSILPNLRKSLTISRVSVRNSKRAKMSVCHKMEITKPNVYRGIVGMDTFSMRVFADHRKSPKVWHTDKFCLRDTKWNHRNPMFAGVSEHGHAEVCVYIIVYNADHFGFPTKEHQ